MIQLQQSTLYFVGFVVDMNMRGSSFHDRADVVGQKPLGEVDRKGVGNHCVTACVCLEVGAVCCFEL